MGAHAELCLRGLGPGFQPRTCPDLLMDPGELAYFSHLLQRDLVGIHQ